MNYKKFIVELNNYYQKDSVGRFVLSKEEIEAITNQLIERKKLLPSRLTNIKINGLTIKAVRYKETINLDLFSLKSRREIVKSFILKMFKDSNVYTTDGINVTMTDNSAAKISRLTYDKQQEIAITSDKMIQIAELESIAVSFKKKKACFVITQPILCLGKLFLEQHLIFLVMRTAQDYTILIK